MPTKLTLDQLSKAFAIRQGFTGSRAPSARMIDTVRDTLRERQAFSPSMAVIVGGCIGIDAEVARTATALGIHVHVVLPADRSRVDPEWQKWCTSYHEMPPGSSYKDRNAEVVRRSTTLVAVPAAPESASDSRRSGTWMTVRLARAAAIPVFVIRCFNTGANEKR